MEKITLYKYIREDGGVTVSPNKPDVEYTVLYRLVADEDKILAKDDDYRYCTDTEDPESWEEVDVPELMKEVI